ncbi:MAG: hypothetical protein R3E53_10945 [Myxococcota bacterium]
MYSALASGHGADAVLYTSLELVDLLDTGSEVVLCGAIEPVYWPGPRPPRHTVLARGLCLQVASSTWRRASSTGSARVSR